MTPLRSRLIEEITLRNYSPRTVEAYVHAISSTAESQSTPSEFPEGDMPPSPGLAQRAYPGWPTPNTTSSLQGCSKVGRPRR